MPIMNESAYGELEQRIERDAAEARKALSERREQAKAFLGRLWDAIGDKGEIHPNNNAPEGIYEFAFYAYPFAVQSDPPFISGASVVFTLWYDSGWRYKISGRWEMFSDPLTHPETLPVVESCVKEILEIAG